MRKSNTRKREIAQLQEALARAQISNADVRRALHLSQKALAKAEGQLTEIAEANTRLKADNDTLFVAQAELSKQVSELQQAVARQAG